MKLPNGYGSVVKLKGSRRKPYAIKVSYMEEQPDGTAKRKRKYIEYFQTKALALTYLAEYNNGAIVKEHESYAQSPTFAELYEKWKIFRQGLKTNPSDSTWKNYDIAFNMYVPIHHKKVVSIRSQDLQECVSAQSAKSKTTIGNMRAILKGMYAYAINNSFVDKDLSSTLVYEYTDSDHPIHTHFTPKEISYLWDNLYEVNNVDVVLIYIYTGLRPIELLEITRENVHLNECYMIGGMKTDAGRDRIIPICDTIYPLVEARYNQMRSYLITTKYGNHYTVGSYRESNWKTLMNKLNLNHSPHDCRYTFAYLADRISMNETCKKIIMGHALPNKDRTAFKTGGKTDVTRDVYTEKTLEDLLREVNKLPDKDGVSHL